MDINGITNERLINLSLNAASKEEALIEMTNMLAAEGVVNDTEQFLKDVYLREELGPTGIGNYIAIPHGKSDAVVKTSIAIGRTEEAIAWETLDDNPVKCIILFAVRKVDGTTVHLELLAEVASSLAEEETLDKLLIKSSPEEIIDALK